MSNIHALTMDNKGQLTVVLHLPIPVENNAAGFPLRTALINSGIGGKTVLTAGDGTIGTISAAELTSIQAGAIYEVTVNPQLDSANNAGRISYIDNLFTKCSADELAKLRILLKFFGWSR